MAVNYRDNTPFEGDNHTVGELAEAIRTKMYGVDVRESIAQSVEKLNGVTNKIDNFNENLRKTFDIDVDFFPLTMVSGKYIDASQSTAIEKSDTRVNHSQKVDVSSGETFFVFSKNFWDGRCVVLVDDNNTVVAKFPENNDASEYHLEINIPDGVVGMYINCYNTTTPFVSKFKNYVAKSSNEIREIRPNFVFSNVSYNTIQGFFWSTGQGLHEDGRSVAVATPLKVRAGEIYRVSGRNFYQGKLFLLFDEARNLVSGFEPEDAQIYSNVVFQVPDEAKFLVLTGYGSAPILEKWTGVISSVYNGFRWEAIGDSWTAKNTLGSSVKNYTDYTAENLGLSVVNRGLGGTGYLADDNGNGTTFSERSYSADADVYTVFGSFNDAYVSGKTIGVISDIGENTLYGSIKLAIEKIVSANPKAKIGLIAPAPWGNINPQKNSVLGAWSMPANEFAEKYVKAIEDVAKLYGLPFLDMYHESAMRPYDESFLSLFYHGTSETDTTHPNTEGHEFFAPQIADFIKKIL